MKNILIFAAGAGVGAGVTWYFTKKFYQKVADEEIKEVVTKFKKYKKQIDEVISYNDCDLTNNERTSRGTDNEHISERTISDDTDEELFNGIIDNPNGENEETAPYVISEEEFGEIENYDQKTLFWYYRDNILATDEDLEVEDKFTTIGDALEEFRKDRYVEKVLVKNEQDETYYEILISEKHFYEVTGGDIE